jgi:hypothetical protein
LGNPGVARHGRLAHQRPNQPLSFVVFARSSQFFLTHPKRRQRSTRHPFGFRRPMILSHLRRRSPPVFQPIRNLIEHIQQPLAELRPSQAPASPQATPFLFGLHALIRPRHTADVKREDRPLFPDDALLRFLENL